ncbi:Hpt domain-containing protein [Nitriliruptor alkaliphilus]|uniref:Hpt domain-containing protein n=1 Tax=Nitriliruptor alkaliphilus TaxID=427918 RepID=UPI000698D70C|nr:Hpt domain-containing protein [Nitriliruptor alkaliphilus]
MSDQDDDELIAQLWLEVRPHQLVSVDELVADVTAVQADRTSAAWQRVRATSHRLAGTLGSFGQQPAGDIALALDRVVGGVEQPDQTCVDRAAELAVALRDEMHRAADER